MSTAVEVGLALGLVERGTLTEESGDLVAQAPPEAHRPRVQVSGLPDGLRGAIAKLAHEWVSMDVLTSSALQSAGFGGMATLQRALALLDRGGFIVRRLEVGGRPVASLHPQTVFYRHQDGRVDTERSYALSRFAFCRREGDALLVETPRGHAHVRLLSSEAAALVGALARPRRPAELAADAGGWPEDAAVQLVDFLLGAGAVVEEESGRTSDEQGDPALAQWEFHDLLFHARSRLGRHANPYGGTFRFKGRFEPLPAMKPLVSEETIPLFRPDLERLAREDRPFSTVLESRRSIREQGERPITADQLGEFLFRAARVQKIVPEAGVSFRPHPAGGAMHEMEIYPLLHHCDGIPPALYRYDALEHRLEKVAGPGPALDALLDMAASTSELGGRPQVLLILAARFQRVQWKYQSMAYALILKHVGVLYQTMYLVATAMGLAPCALGGGHADLFASAAGLDYFAESSVGEFILGSTRE